MRNKRKKFIELAEARVNKTIKNIRLIGNLSNRSSYEYSEQDAKEIFRILQKELERAMNRFDSTDRIEHEAFRLSSRRDWNDEDRA